MSSNDAITILDAKSVQILDILHESGLQVTDPGGFASRQIADQLPDEDRKRISDYLRKLEDYGLINRHINGKRTYEIHMTDTGIDALMKVRPLMENNQEPDTDLSSVTADDLIEGLRYHMQNMHSSEICKASELEDRLHYAEAKLDLVSEAINELDMGNSTWVQTFDRIRHILSPIDDEPAHTD